MSQADTASVAPTEEARMPSFKAALRVWTKIGLLSFGGPAGQIALLHREVVDDRNWVSDQRFLHALSFCNLLPGPEAQQLATYLGWLMHGVKGGLAAGIIFVLPGAVVMLALSLIYALAGHVPVIDALFFGLKSAVLVLVVDALLRIGRRALKGRVAWTLAGAAFVALFVFKVPFPAVVLTAGAIGYAMPGHFIHGGHGQARHDRPALIDAALTADPTRPYRLAAAARRAGFVALAMWLLPVVALMGFAGQSTFADIAWFFSKMAVVTIGGAYAVLAYVAQDAVGTYHWLAPQEMLSGLGLAETTPGPLILVLQFVGFLAGYRSPGAVSGVPGGILGSVLTLWVTFAPCFTFVFLGAPFIERLQSNKFLTGSLAAITASVVGVVGNLAVWFALQVLFHDHVALSAGPLTITVPVLASIDFAALALALLAAICLFRLKRGVLQTLGITAAAGLVFRLTIPAWTIPAWSSIGKEFHRMIKTASALLAVMPLLTSAPAARAQASWDKVAIALGKAGAEMPGGVYRVGLPRTDLHVVLDGVEIKPTLALGSWLAFRTMDNMTMVMGDLVLTETEISPVMKQLAAGGIQITALHNHLLRAQPATFYMHILGQGDATKLAATLHEGLALSGTPFANPAAASPPPAIDLDTAMINQTLGAKGQIAGGVFQVNIRRAETIQDNGMEVPVAMGSAEAINFQPTGGGKAAITGDFVLTAAEVNPVLRTLRDNGIEVTALHNHMLDDQPRLFFMHFWANDDVAKLSKGLRAALDKVNVARS